MKAGLIIKRTLIGILTVALLGLVLAISIVSYVLTTTDGLQRVLGVAKPYIPGELSIERVEGALIKSLTLQGLVYRHPDITISIKRLHLAWLPVAFLDGRLQITALEVDQSDIRITQSAKPEPTPVAESVFPIQLPELQLPLQLSLDRLLVTQLRLHPAPGDTGEVAPIIVDSLLLQAHTDGQTLMLEQFNIKTPQGALALQGQLSTIGSMPLRLNTDWQVDLPEYGTLQGQGSLEGDLETLQVKHQLSGLFSAQLSAQFKELLIAPQGSIQVEALEADLGLALPELAGQLLRGKFNLAGDLQGGSLQGQWQAPLPELGASDLRLQVKFTQERLHIEQIRLVQQGTGAEFYLSGQIDQLLQTPQLALKGGWKNLRYPFVEEAMVNSASGKFDLKGALTNYQLALNAALVGPQIPDGQWQLQAQGSDKGMGPLSIKGDTLAGQLQAKGQVYWSPNPSWQIALTGQKLNPAVLWPDFPADLDLNAQITGRLNAGQPLQLEAELYSLSGRFKDEALQGTAKVTLNGSELSVQQLQLVAAGAELTAEGLVGEQLDLDWSLTAPQLDKLLPTADGSLKGSGSLRGSLAQLYLKAQVQGQRLAFENNRIADLVADLDVDLSATRNSQVNIQAHDLVIADQRWKLLSVNGQGTPASHNLSLSLEQGPADLQLAVSGSWLDPLWRGTISRLELSQELTGAWQLQRPAKLEAGAASASIESFCLERQPLNTGQFCGQGRWSMASGVLGSLQTQQLSMKLLDPWLPVGTDVQGELQAQAEFSMKAGEQPEYQVRGRILDTELYLEDEDLRVKGGEMTLNMKGSQQRLEAELNLPLLNPVGSVQAKLSVDQLYTRPQFDGQMDTALSDLKFISLFAPELQGIKGTLESVLNLSGTLEEPLVEGYLHLINGSAELPAVGIKLDEIELAFRDQPNSPSLELTGSLRSGGGRMQLSGLFSPLPRTGEITIKGERVQAVDTREVKAWISPDIIVSIAPDLLKIRGEVKIPEAKITPPPITFSAALSEDIVILDSQASTGLASKAPRQRLDAQLRLTLGDKVEVDALGFKGRLQGSVLIEDDERRATRATGVVLVAAGKYRLYGQDLNIERGSLVYSGGPVDNPGLDLRVSRKVDEVTAGARVSGTLNSPKLALFSEPAMPESSLLSYLILGRSPNEESTTPSEQELMLKAAIALATMGGNAVAENVMETLSVDELSFDSSDSNTNTSLYIGKYLSPRLYVKYGVGLLEPTNTFFMRYKLNKNWSLESETGTNNSGGDIIYTLER